MIKLKKFDDLVDLRKNLELKNYLQKRLGKVGLNICVDDDGYAIWGNDKDMNKNIYNGMAKVYRSKYYNQVSVRPNGVYEIDDSDDPLTGGNLLPIKA